MATTEFDEKPRVITPRNSRRNEIVAILLLAVGLLLTLCLVSAAFYPGDPSWNSAGQAETRNWAGAIGANVAAGLLQSIGLAAYLLPLLLLAAAWRRFKTRSFRAPFYRLLGLVILTLAAAALLSISNLRPLFRFQCSAGRIGGNADLARVGKRPQHRRRDGSADRTRRHRSAAGDELLLYRPLRKTCQPLRGAVCLNWKLTQRGFAPGERPVASVRASAKRQRALLKAEVGGPRCAEGHARVESGKNGLLNS